VVDDHQRGLLGLRWGFSIFSEKKRKNWGSMQVWLVAHAFLIDHVAGLEPIEAV
jgi:hypothetical protein